MMDSLFIGKCVSCLFCFYIDCMLMISREEYRSFYTIAYQLFLYIVQYLLALQLFVDILELFDFFVALFYLTLDILIGYFLPFAEICFIEEKRSFLFIS